MRRSHSLLPLRRASGIERSRHDTDYIYLVSDEYREHMMTWLNEGYLFAGHPEMAIELASRALERADMDTRQPQRAYFFRLLGDLVTSQESLAMARSFLHAYHHAFAISMATLFHQLRQEQEAVQEMSEAGIAVTTEQGFAMFLAYGTLFQGWAMSQQKQSAEGLAKMHQGLDAIQGTGAAMQRPHFLGLLSEGYRASGKLDKALPILEEALTLVEKTSERYYEAELYRLKGELLRLSPSDCDIDAESCFQQAIQIAQSQAAKSWELRAAMSLARLWRSQDKRREAYELLAPVYEWFTEGFDTADLKDAKTLLTELA